MLSITRQSQVNTLHVNHSQRPVLDLPTPEGWKAELTRVSTYIHTTTTYQDGLHAIIVFDSEVMLISAITDNMITCSGTQ